MIQSQKRTASLGKGHSAAHLRVERALSTRLHVGWSCSRRQRSAQTHQAANDNIRSVDGGDAGSIPALKAAQGTLPSAASVPNSSAAEAASRHQPATLGQPAATSSARQIPDDDGFARAWKPPPGEPPLWWVEKFEARRKAEAKRKAEDPSFVTTQERVTAADKADKAGNPAVRFLLAVLQVIQLLVVLALLLLFPAALHDGGLSLAKPFTTYAAYLAFFGLGSVARVVQYGKLAPRKQDRQVATWGGRLAFAAFITILPLLHWYGMYRFVGLSLYTSLFSVSTTVYDIVGAAGMLMATVLNVAAARELGASYDRVAVPAALVTSGPYKYVQHPIYTSYMLLFFSYGMWLHSAPVALAMLLVCAAYYGVRTALEGRVLEEAFGGYYRDYASRTKKFVPFVV